MDYHLSHAGDGAIMVTRCRKDEVAPGYKLYSNAAICLRLPPAWLKEELDAGTLPGLKIGNGWLVDVNAIRCILTDRLKAALELWQRRIDSGEVVVTQLSPEPSSQSDKAKL